MKGRELGSTLLAVAAFVFLVACGFLNPAEPTPHPGTIPPPANTPPPSMAPDQGFVGLPSPPPGQYVFVEIWLRIEGTGNLPKLMIDFPGYRFDRLTGALKPFGDGKGFTLSPSAWGFVGSGTTRAGDAGGGASSSLAPITRLPYSTSLRIFTGSLSGSQESMQSVPVVLEGVDAEGRLQASVDGQSVVLAPGESWTRKVEAEVGGRYEGRYRVTSSLTNFGWQPRGQISR